MLDKPGVFTYRDGVAVIQLVPFTVYLCLGLVLCWRHGFRRSEGWVIMVTFSILRILAACFQLASISNQNSVTLGGALICQGIGLAPLTLLSLGLFMRLNRHLDMINRRIFSIISIVSIAGIAVAIYGGTESATSATLATNSLLKASIILFLACYVAFLVLFLLFLRRRQEIPRGERKLLTLFVCCIPFMVIRFVYGLIGTFSESLRPQFSVLTGDVTTFLCMAVLEEIIVVAFYAFTGMRLERLPAVGKERVQRSNESG